MPYFESGLGAPLIIEFTGNPGSGKSTLAGAFRRELDTRGYHTWLPNEYWKDLGLIHTGNRYKRVGGIIKKFSGVARAALSNIPALGAIPWCDILMYTSFRHKKIILGAFATNLAEREVLKREVKRNTIALLDEGIVHRIYSLFVFPQISVNMTSVFKYLRAVDLPDLLVYVRSSIPSCMERMIKRGLPLRLENMQKSEILSMMAKGEETLDTVVEKIQSIFFSKVDVLELDGGNIPDGTKKILNWLDCKY